MYGHLICISSKKRKGLDEGRMRIMNEGKYVLLHQKAHVDKLVINSRKYILELKQTMFFHFAKSYDKHSFHCVSKFPFPNSTTSETNDSLTPFKASNGNH